LVVPETRFRPSLFAVRPSSFAIRKLAANSGVCVAVQTPTKQLDLRQLRSNERISKPGARIDILLLKRSSGSGAMLPLAAIDLRTAKSHPRSQTGEYSWLRESQTTKDE